MSATQTLHCVAQGTTSEIHQRPMIVQEILASDVIVVNM